MEQEAVDTSLGVMRPAAILVLLVAPRRPLDTFGRKATSRLLAAKPIELLAVQEASGGHTGLVPAGHI